MKIIQSISILIVVILCCRCSGSNIESLIYQKLGACNSEDLDSTILCGTFSVFENRQTNAGRKIDLNVIVIPAINKRRSKAPIFYLEGGPGVAGTSSAPFYADTANYYRLEHDIVLIDVRGTGDSNPLHCRQLQYKANLEEQFSEMYPVEAVKECYDSLSKLADLTQYTTTNMAIDIDEVRKWLGYDKINLFGLSFGGRLAQVYMKMFPSAVESCVLWSPATTYSKMPLYFAQDADASLKRLFEDCRNDSSCNLAFPNLAKEFDDLKERGKAKNFVYKFKGQNGDVKELSFPWYSFHTKIRSLMYAPVGLREVPFLIHQSYLGNWTPFISLFPNESSFAGMIAEGLYLCVTCTEDVPYITQEAADSVTAGTFMGDYRIQQQRNACSHWAKGYVPDKFFEPVRSDIPTMVVAGYFDPVTPPYMAEKIVQTLTNGYLVTIPTMSHLFDGLSSPECFDKMVVEFFNTPHTRPNSECIQQMLPGQFRIKE